MNTRDHPKNEAYRQRLYRALLFIEANLDRQLSLAEVASQANLSPYHFHRIFHALVGESLGIYLRRIRLERAALHLQFVPASVTEVGYAAGYGSPSAFTKAFHRHFGVSPSDFRRQKRSSDSSAPMRSTHHLSKEHSMSEPYAPLHFRTVPPQPVLFVRENGTYPEAAPKAWAKLMRFARTMNLVDEETLRFAIAYDDPDITEASQLRYDACIAVSPEVAAEGDVGRQTLAGGRYAIFLHQGPYRLLETTCSRVFGEWLPTSDHRLRDAPCLTRPLDLDPPSVRPEDLRTEYWVPIEG